MESRCFVAVLVFNACLLGVGGVYTELASVTVPGTTTPISFELHNEEGSSPQHDFYARCSDTPGYVDLNEMSSLTFYARKLNQSATLECSNCEQSGLPESVTCAGKNDPSNATKLIWTCSAEFPQISNYKINSTSLDCKQHAGSTRCVDLGTCSLTFSVKKIVSNTGEIALISIVVIIIFIAMLIDFRRSMKNDRALFASRVLWLQEFSMTAELFGDAKRRNDIIADLQSRAQSSRNTDAHYAIALSTSARFSSLASYNTIDNTNTSYEQVV